MKPYAVTCIFLACISFFANATELPINKGMPFLNARKALIKQGWEPNLTDEMDPDGLMKTLRNMGISEVQRCTEGVQYCEFNYKRNNQCLVVSTTGEKVKDMRINNWGFNCPDVD
jgi:hypothetical protein